MNCKDNRFVLYCLLTILLSTLPGCAANFQPAAEFPAGSGRLQLLVSGFRSDRGQAIIHLYSGPRGFPEQPSPGRQVFFAPIEQGKVVLDLPDLPYSDYAAGVMHDENGNGKMDRGLFGRPLEGFGFSRNAGHRRGPPDFSRASFLLLQPQQRQEIHIDYPSYPRSKLFPEADK